MKTYTVILCGATGDLARRKIIPGLYDVMRSDAAVRWRIIGVAHDGILAAEMMQAARASIKDLDDGVWYALCENAQYISGDLNSDATYQAVARAVNEYDENRLVYCATPSELFIPITEKLINHGVIHRQDTDESTWHRVAYEKPFGRDGASAVALNNRLTVLLNEVQIYRVDHYLGKKATMALPAARMLDESFNDLWMKGAVDFVQVIVNESAGVGTRGAYYDAYGALKDMVQNHLLQVVALLLARDPVLDYPELCNEKKAILDALTFVDGAIGQYAGYTDEVFVNPTSTTETFAALRLGVTLPRWENLAVYIKTGKKLGHPKMVIYTVFRSSDTTKVGDMPLAVIGYDDNQVALIIGEEQIAHALSVSTGGPQDEQEFLHAYGRVLEFILQGDKTIFVSFAEIAQSWRIVDDIISRQLPLFRYAPGSAGPAELEEFNARNGVKWIL